MLIQPDSRLYNVPIQGGKSEKLSCNLPLMNSWHTWSPNGKWIVFVSKGFSVYTDMLLTHIDEEGNASPPVLLEKARQYRRVANYPEFLNTKPGFQINMVYDYVELAHIKKAVDEDDIKKAIVLYKRLKDQDPILFNNDDYLILYECLKKMGLKNEIDSLERKVFTKSLN